MNRTGARTHTTGPSAGRPVGSRWATGAFDDEAEVDRPTLREGSRGSAVTTLQARLAALRFDPGPVDGVFGARTGSAVRAFQGGQRLPADGIVGPRTWAALDRSRTPAPAPAPPPTAPPVPWGGRREVALRVPFRGYQSNDKAGCFRRCTEMAAAVGVRVGGPDVRIQVAIREDAKGRVTIDPAKAREGTAYIDARLEAGDPVVVGVSYMDSDYNVDDITDHFVIVTRRGTDPDGDLCYGFHDPASQYVWLGGDGNSANRFYLTAEGGLFRLAAASATAAPLHTHIYDVAMVRRNL